MVFLKLGVKTLASAIEFIILPKASLDGSKGQLQAGDKVKPGTFAGGKTISWVLFQNAWTGSGVNVNATKYFSCLDFNTMESNVNKGQHSVQFVDYARQLLINFFEDLTRYTGSDNDFNDLTFYTIANPWAVSSGTLNSNWFTDEAGNRKSQFIY